MVGESESFLSRSDSMLIQGEFVKGVLKAMFRCDCEVKVK